MNSHCLRLNGKGGCHCAWRTEPSRSLRRRTGGSSPPFALESPDQLRPEPPAPAGSYEYLRQAADIVELSAGLTDRRKAIATYWADGPNTETPPGHWNLLAQWVSRRDRHTLDEDVKLFFVLGNALLDASIATSTMQIAEMLSPCIVVRLGPTTPEPLAGMKTSPRLPPMRCRRPTDTKPSRLDSRGR